MCGKGPEFGDVEAAEVGVGLEEFESGGL